MVRPTHGAESSAADKMAAGSNAGDKNAGDKNAGDKNAAAEARRMSPAATDEATRAREFLERLGCGDHPDAASDPVYALYQAAVDFQCSAYGYRELYLRKKAAKP